MPAWTWASLGIILLIAEIFSPSGFVLVLLGVAALATGALRYIGVLDPAWLQWVTCGGLSVVLLAFVRKHVIHSVPPNKKEFVGSPATLSTSIEPGGVGEAECSGTSWRVRNVDATPMLKGDRGIVVDVDGLTLLLKREK